MKTEETTGSADVAEQGAQVAPEKVPATKAATSKKGAPKGQKAGKGAKRAVGKAAPKKASKKAEKNEATPTRKKAAKSTEGQPREGSKKATVIEMLRRKDGATLAEIAKATDWQAQHPGLCLRSLTKKMGLKVESTKNEAGERTYRIK